MRLRILDPSVHVTPASVVVKVTGGSDDDTLEFRFDGTFVWRYRANRTGDIDGASVPIPFDTTAGDHTLSVHGSDGDSSSATVHVRRNSFRTPRIPPLDVDPVKMSDAHGWHQKPWPPHLHHNYVPFQHRHWVFQDLAPEPYGLGSWVLPLNPNRMSSPHWSRNLEVTHTTAHEGRPMVWQQGHHARDWQFSGYCPDESFHNQLLAYRRLHRRIYIIDHRDRAWETVIVDVDLRTRNDPDNFWAHDYTVRTVIYNQRALTPQ